MSEKKKINLEDLSTEQIIDLKVLFQDSFDEATSMIDKKEKGTKKMNEKLEGFLIMFAHVFTSTVFLAIMLGINLSWDIYWLIFIDEPNFLSSLVILLVTLTAIIYFVIIWFIVIGDVLIKLGIWRKIEITQITDNDDTDMIFTQVTELTEEIERYD